MKVSIPWFHSLNIFLFLSMFLCIFSKPIYSEVKKVIIFKGVKKLLDLNYNANLSQLRPGFLRSTTYEITSVDPLLLEGSQLVLYYSMGNLTDYYKI